jgi:lipopolysaccharide transport protein LptA
MKIFIVTLFSLLAALAFAADDTGKITIHAANVRYFGEENRSTFTGNVVMVNSVYTVTADKADVFAETGAIKTIRCSSNVNIKTEELLALSNFANIDTEGKIITIFGNARVWQENNYIEGDRITYNYTTREISVHKGNDGKKVRVIVTPDED